MKKHKNKTILHPIITFFILIVVTVILSGILKLLGLSTNYNIINPITGELDSTTVSVISLLNLSGMKQIFSTTVSNFISFTPFSTLIILLIGIGIIDKSGFLQSFFTLVTKKAKKNTVTYILALTTIIASIVGDISFVILIPIMALFFKYSKRNPLAGIIMTYAGLTCGVGINIFMNSIESSLLQYTKLAAMSLDATYSISKFSYIGIMLLMTFIMAYVVSTVTEKVIVPKLGKYDLEEEEFYLDKKKKRGLLFSIPAGILYLLVFIYNIIPGLPFSGNLLDYSQNLYIDKLFGYNSFFNHGFVFVITIFFFICGLTYGIGAKTIKNNRDVSNYLGHSLDDIGKTIVLIFFASTFISIFKETNIGTVMTALIAKFIASTSFTGIPLILITFILLCFVNILIPSPITAWSILSGVIVPVFMNAGMTPEFSELIFRASECVTYGLTPLMAYFVIYLSYLDNYGNKEKPISLFGSFKLILPYVGITSIIWITLLIISYVIGLPLGIGTNPIL